MVVVSAGSVCTSANPKPSNVLQAVGIDSDRWERTIRLDSATRFGLARSNTMEETEYVADHIRYAVAELH